MKKPVIYLVDLLSLMYSKDRVICYLVTNDGSKFLFDSQVSFIHRSSLTGYVVTHIDDDSGFGFIIHVRGISDET